MLAKLGIVVDEGTRKDARKKSGAVTVKKIGSKFYALDKHKADAAGISNVPADRKSVVIALGNKAEGILLDNGVQKLVRQELLGLLDESYKIGLEDYFDGKENLKVTPTGGYYIQTRRLLQSTVETMSIPPQIKDRSTIYLLIAADKGVMDAVKDNRLDNNKTWKMVEALGNDGALKGADGNFDRQKVLDAIKTYSAGSGGQEQTGQQTGTETNRSETLTSVGNIGLADSIQVPKWLFDLTRNPAVDKAVEGVDAGKLTTYLKGVADKAIEGTITKNNYFLNNLLVGIEELKSEGAGYQWGDLQTLEQRVPGLYALITGNEGDINTELLKRDLGGTKINQQTADKIMNEFVRWTNAMTDHLSIGILNGISNVEDLVGKAVYHYQIQMSQ